jgi:23S rRNA (cytidine1920-2'-O)/16S rRNA (cytidine1409-2'-O)-methyltransferase
MGKRDGKQSLITLMQQQFPEYSRDQLRAFIDCRQVVIEGETCVDAQGLFPQGSRIELVINRYVSRGGRKLEHALNHWAIDVSDLVMVDAGSSTGGFTDCLLQHGAAKVHAVDVGYNQLDYRLRTDDRVIVHEQQNIMHVTSFDPQPQAAVADLSFRSVAKAASHILSLVSQSWMISLIKPQFELVDIPDDFTGIVDSHQLLPVLMDVYDLLREDGVGLLAIIESPIQGRKGNREFLALLAGNRLGLNRTSYHDTVTALLAEGSSPLPK